MAADERREPHMQQKLLTLGADTPIPPLTLDDDSGEVSLEACREQEADGSQPDSLAPHWPGAKQTAWASKAALPGEEHKGYASGDEETTTGRMTVDELEHELAVERTKRMEVSLELQESARVGQMLLERNEQLEQEVLNLQDRLEASRSEAAKDSDGDAGSRFAEMEWQLQQSARVGQMLLDRNEELEKEVQGLRQQVETSRSKSARFAEDSDSEGTGLRGNAASSSRARAGSECSSRRGRRPSRHRGNSNMSEGSCTTPEAHADRGPVLWADADAIMARNDYLEGESERFREQFSETPHRKHANRRRVSTGMFMDAEPGFRERTDTISQGDEEVSEVFRSRRRRLTSSADGLCLTSNEDVIQGYGGARERANTAMEELRTPSSDLTMLREQLQEAIEHNQELTEECERLEAIVRNALEREREMNDLLQQERAAAEWAAKEAAREVHGARQAGLDAGLEVVRERRRQSVETERRRSQSEPKLSQTSASQKEMSASPDVSDSEDALTDSTDSEVVAELRERIDELEVKYNEAKHQAWEAHQDMMDLRGLLSAAQVNCQDLEDMAAEKQLALQEEQRRNSSLSEQIQELRHMLEDQRRRQSVLMMCKQATSEASEESCRSPGSNPREGNFLDLVHLHRLASRSLPLSRASSRRNSRAVSRQGSRDSRASISSTGVDDIRTAKSLGGRASRLSMRDESLERSGSVPRRRVMSPRSRLLEDSRSSRPPDNSLTLNALLRMEGHRISERPEEEDRASSVKDQGASLEAESENAGDEDLEDLEFRHSSDEAVSSGSSSAGSRQDAGLDPDIEDFNEQSRALLQALLIVTREKPAGASQHADAAEVRAAKVRHLFLNDIAKLEGPSAQPVQPRTSVSDTGRQHESRENAITSSFKSLQARWRKTFATEVAALTDSSQAGEQPASLRRSSTGTCATDEVEPHQAEIGYAEARSLPVTQKEIQDFKQKCKQQLQDCADERLPEEDSRSTTGDSDRASSTPEGRSSPLQAGSSRTITEKPSLHRRPHPSADTRCTFFSIASDGSEEYKRKPTEMLDSFLEGVDFSEEAKPRLEPLIATDALDVKKQSNAAQSKVRMSWMQRAGWRREGREEEAGGSSTSLSLAKETTAEEPPVMDRRKKWGFSAGALSPSRFFESSARASTSAAVADAVDPQAVDARSPSGTGAPKEADELASVPSSSEAGGSCSPYQSASGSLAGSPDNKAVSSATTAGDTPSDSSSRSSTWGFSWGGSQALARKGKSRRLKTLRIAVGGSLDEGSPLACSGALDEGALLECAEEEEKLSEANDEPADEASAELLDATSSSEAIGASPCAEPNSKEEGQPSDLCGQSSPPMEYFDSGGDAFVNPTQGTQPSLKSHCDDAAPFCPSADTGEQRATWFQMDSEDSDPDTVMESGEEPSRSGARRKLSMMSWMEGRVEDFEVDI